jgi:predicted O-methyltransferase YrrM
MTPEAVMKSIEQEATRRGLPIIGPVRGRILDDMIAQHNPSSILEIGTLVGYSAIRMGRHLRSGQSITCVELKDEMAQVARKNIERAGLSERITVKVGDAKKVLPGLEGTYDMVFLDAVKDEYLGYLRSVERLLHKGSIVVADNVKSHAAEVSGYLDYVRNSGKYHSEYREPPAGGPDAVEISVKL